MRIWSTDSEVSVLRQINECKVLQNPTGYYERSYTIVCSLPDVVTQLWSVLFAAFISCFVIPFFNAHIYTDPDIIM